MNNNEGKNMLYAFIAGAIAGGSVALLSQTEKGKELMKEASDIVTEKCKKAKETVVETEQDLEARFRKAMADLDVNSLEKKGKETIAELKEKFNNETEQQ